MGSLRVVWLPPTTEDMHLGLGQSKLPRGVNLRVWLFVCPCQPCSELATCPVCTLLFPNISWDMLEHPLQP